MGLDMYCYSTPESNVVDNFSVKELEQLEEFWYWRKHNALHGRMEDLYKHKYNGSGEFNCRYVRLTEEVLLELKSDVEGKLLKCCAGFFWGGQIEYDDLQRDADLEFVKQALELVRGGKALYYYSWW